MHIVTELVSKTLDALYDSITTDSIEHSFNQEMVVDYNLNQMDDEEKESYEVVAALIHEHFKNWGSDKPVWTIKAN